VDIPDGDPHAAALAIWRDVHPNAAAELRERIAADAAALADWLDHARTNTGLSLLEFVRRASVLVARRNTLADRLATIEGSAAVDRGPLAAEVFALAVGVFPLGVDRWRGREILRTERQRAIQRLGQELATVEGDIQHTAATHAHSRMFTVQSPEHKAGFTESADVWLGLMTSMLQRRAELQARLAALGDDQAERARSVSVVVGTLGELAVVESVASAMPAPSDFGASALEAQIRALDSRLAGLDPETRQYEQLSGDRQRLQARLGDARKAQAGSQADAARRLVAEASSGSLEHIAQLQPHVSHPDLASALATARGVDEHFIATVGEMIR
jgi:hypothetical protein